MSAKWQRSKRWDDQFFPPWAWPAKATLRAFSSIPLAVALLSFVVLYGTLASVPIGLIALIPTWAIVALTLIATVAALAAPTVMLIRRALRGADRASRFAATFTGAILITAGAVALWLELLWPALRHSPATGEGLRLFPAFVETYKSTTIRRLPAFEMTEGEFYAWWPLRVVLILFIVNMITATVRRIEFKFVNLGVLTVHTGIVILTLGSIHYQNLKQEGDVLLLAGSEPGVPGPAVTSFMDRTKPALWASLDNRGWSAMQIDGLPRYNDYGVALSRPPLDLDLPDIPPAGGGDPIDLRIVGFGSYVEMQEGWISQTEPPAHRAAPLIDLEIISAIPDEDGSSEPRTVAELRLPSASPAERIVDVGGALQIEHVPPGDERWAWLGAPLPAETLFALVTPDDGDGFILTPVQPGDVVTSQGFTATVRSIHPTAPFPIITPGYEGADSSVAILDVTSPEGEAFERWVFHRFPELNQDIRGVRDDGRPDRRPADPELRIDLIDAGMMHVFVRPDEAIVRYPGGAVERFENLGATAEIPLAPMVSLRIARVWPHAELVERPVIVPEVDRRKDFVGTHDRAAIAVELSAPGGWRETVWLPFSRFMNVAMGTDRAVELPDGRTLRLAFSRTPRPLPGITLRLIDFEMVPYPHSDIPRDYISKVAVNDGLRQESYTQMTRLNRPLIHRVPFQWSDDRPFVANAIGSVVNVIAPNRYKFSQAGWDAEGWRETAAQAEAGELDRPRAAFTILGVGNNPGIHIIALGGVLVCVGTPWAFYVKPWLLRRKRDRLKREHANRAKEAASRRPSVTESKELAGVSS